jgi:hypothetical protein
MRACMTESKRLWGKAKDLTASPKSTLGVANFCLATWESSRAYNKEYPHTRPSREETLLSDSILKIYSLFAGITSMQVLAIGALLLSVAAMLLTVTQKKRKVVLVRSVVTDELGVLLARIAEALERPVNQRADRIIAAASQPAEPPAASRLTEQAHSRPYSILGQ